MDGNWRSFGFVWSVRLVGRLVLCSATFLFWKDGWNKMVLAAARGGGKSEFVAARGE